MRYQLWLEFLQKERGGKVAIDSRPGLFGSATGDPGASDMEHFPFDTLTLISAIEEGELNSAT